MTTKLVDNQIHIETRDGSNRPLWKGVLAGPDKVLPRRYWLWGWGFELPGDRCGDLVISGGDDDASFYGVFDGADGRLLWTCSTAPKSQWPRFTDRRDLNDC